jgi:NADH-quinone oxidoreductase subunit M
MLLLVERVFFGKITKAENRSLPDLSVREAFVLAPMVALIVVMGLVPQPFLAPAKTSVDRLVRRFEAAEARMGVPTSVGTVIPAVAAAAAPAARPVFPTPPGIEAAPDQPAFPTPSGGIH